MDESFGILYGNISETYANIGRAMANLDHDFVGLFYPTSSRTTIILFRSFDGSKITYFDNYLTIQRFSRSKIITKLETLYFNNEIWTVDGNKDNLCDRFLSTINRTLLYGTSQSNCEFYLRHLVGLEKSNPVNGYQIVNDIILATTNVNRACNHSRSIIENRYLHIPEKRDVPHTEDNIHDDAKMRAEVDSLLKQMTESFCRLLTEDNNYSLLINEIINKSHVKPETTSLTFQQTPTITSIPDSEEEMKYIRNMIENIMSGFSIGDQRSGFSIGDQRSLFNESPKIPVVYIAELVEIYNRLALKLNQPKISANREISKIRSIGILVQSTSMGFETDNIEVSFKSGNKIILPTNYGDFSKFTDDELIQLYKYIKSLQSVDGRFNYMVEQAIRELASRASE